MSQCWSGLPGGREVRKRAGVSRYSLFRLESQVSAHILAELKQPAVSRGFRDSPAGEESPCNSGDPSSIPGSGRSAGAGIGYPLQYSWASLVAQLVKNPPRAQRVWGATFLPTCTFSDKGGQETQTASRGLSGSLQAPAFFE